MYLNVHFKWYLWGHICVWAIFMFVWYSCTYLSLSRWVARLCNAFCSLAKVSVSDNRPHCPQPSHSLSLSLSWPWPYKGPEESRTKTWPTHTKMQRRAPLRINSPPVRVSVKVCTELLRKKLIKNDTRHVELEVQSLRFCRISTIWLIKLSSACF